MNKIIDETHVCTFCHSTRKPISDGIYIYCPMCDMPQFEGVEYNPKEDKSDEIPIYDLDVEIFVRSIDELRERQKTRSH